MIWEADGRLSMRAAESWRPMPRKSWRLCGTARCAGGIYTHGPGVALGRASEFHQHARNAWQLRRQHGDDRTDLLIALGTRFDDRVTGRLAAFAPHAKVIHVDIDPAEIGKNRTPEIPIVGDVKRVLKKLNRRAAKRRRLR